MMFELRQIIRLNAARQHIVGTIHEGDLPIVAAGHIPEIVGGWRIKGHQVSLSADHTMEWVVEACNWLTRRNVRFRIGARWIVEHYGMDVKCTLEKYIISIEQDNSDLFALFHLVFV